MNDVKTNQNSKAKILQAASELFLEKGLPGLSVRAIAARAGLSTIGIYSHFNGKSGLLEALYIEGFALMTDMLQSGEGEDPRQSIRTMCAQYIEIADTHRAHYQLIFGEAGAHYEPSPAARQAGVNAFKRLVSFAAILLPPESSPALKQKTALKIWALMHGFVSLRQHAVAEIMPELDWPTLILEAVDGLVAGLEA